MAVCPHCHAGDKTFFAPKCHNCNTEVGVGEQFAASIMHFVGQLLAFGIVALIIMMLI